MKHITTISTILIIATIIGGCTETSKEQTVETGIKTDTSTSKNATTVYLCPMDCENGKTYADTGKCPVCNMDLEKK